MAGGGSATSMDMVQIRLVELAAQPASLQLSPWSPYHVSQSKTLFLPLGMTVEREYICGESTASLMFGKTGFTCVNVVP